MLLLLSEHADSLLKPFWPQYPARKRSKAATLGDTSFTLICQNLIKPHVQVFFGGRSESMCCCSYTVQLVFCQVPRKKIETNLRKTAKHFKIYMQAACCRRAAHVTKHLALQAAKTVCRRRGCVCVCVCIYDWKPNTLANIKFKHA